MNQREQFEKWWATKVIKYPLLGKQTCWGIEWDTWKAAHKAGQIDALEKVIQHLRVCDCRDDVNAVSDAVKEMSQKINCGTKKEG